VQATIVETTNPSSEYQAKIEEFWLSPSKWRRTIEAPGFSQTMTVNGDQISEKNTGDYLPHWLNEFLTAIFDPLPEVDALKHASAPIPGLRGFDPRYNCSTIVERHRSTICFDPANGLLEEVFFPGYGVELEDYEAFGLKFVPRRIETDPEPGTRLQATITKLEELRQSNDQMFAVERSTSPSERIRIVRIAEDELRALSLKGMEIDWPTVGEGLTVGGCAEYVSADRKGVVREVWPEGCDNASLEDSLRDEVRNWRFKPAIVDGAPVQVESLVTFTFHTTIEESKTPPELKQAEARRLATHTVDPIFPYEFGAKETDLAVRITVNDTGQVTEISTSKPTVGMAFSTACNALEQWRFRPYIVKGKPRPFHAIITFHIPSLSERLWGGPKTQGGSK